jgi:hypothetical protein
MVIRLSFGQPMILGTLLLIVMKGAFGLRRLGDRELEDRVLGGAEPADTTA